MANYKYGVYGMIGDDIAKNASEAGTAPVYIGTAPVNFLPDYAGKVNQPVKISNLSDAVKKIGHFSDSTKWAKFTLCEAVAATPAHTLAYPKQIGRCSLCAEMNIYRRARAPCFQTTSPSAPSSWQWRIRPSSPAWPSAATRSGI